MNQFNWSPEKNQILIEERGISFERVVAAVEQGHMIDVVDHPNQQRYPGQSIYILTLSRCNSASLYFIIRCF